MRHETGTPDAIFARRIAVRSEEKEFEEEIALTSARECKRNLSELQRRCASARSGSGLFLF
jgi:hypothetical protein